MAAPADNNIATATSVGGYIAKEAGLGLYEESTLLAKVDKQYSSEFTGKSGGAQKGNTINVKFPARFSSTSDTAVTSGNTNVIIEDTKALTLDTPVGIFANVDIEQASLELEQRGSEYSTRVLQPMGKQLAVDIEGYGFDKLALGSENVIVMATPYADGEVLRKNFAKLNGKLTKQSAPVGDRCAIINTDGMIEVGQSVETYFNNQAQIDMAFKSGKITEYGGMAWMNSDLVKTRVNGSGGVASLAVASYVEGSTTLTLGSGDGADFVVGDKIEIAAVNLVNAQSKSSYGTLAQRAVTAVAGDVLTISSPFYGATATGGRQNCDAIPQAAAAVTCLGVKGKTYVCAPVFQKNGITMASADLYLPASVEMSAKNKIQGVGTNYVRGFDVNNNQLISRYECLITWDLLRPEWCGVIEMQID